MFEMLRRDLWAAVRNSRHDPWVTAVAAGSLALGIAANTTVFSLVQAVEFPRLPYPEAHRIVVLESQNEERGVAMLVSAPDAIDIAAAARTLETTALAGDQSSVFRVGGASKRVSGRRVSPGFFEVFGLPAALGRTMGAEDQQGVIVLSDSVWRSHFGADPGVVGSSVRLDGGVVTVIGVMPPRFDSDAHFWTPLGSTSAHSRDDRQFRFFARMASTVSVGNARAELAELSRRLAVEYPDSNRAWLMVPIELSRLHGRDVRQSFLMLQGAVALVLLIVCANIANILLARATGRRHEMAVRQSLGATRGRLISTLVMDALVVSIFGGAAGLMLSVWAIPLVRALGGVPTAVEPELNALVLAFTTCVSAVTAAVCGIVPAVRASAVPAHGALREGGRGGALDPRGGRMRAALAAAQIAAALVLTVCAALMLQTLVERYHVGLGFEPRLAVRADVMFVGERYRDPAAIRATVDAIVRDLATRTDVTAAGASTWALPTGAGAQRQMTLPSDGDRLLPSSVRRALEAVTPGYFAALGIPVSLGRTFTEADREGGAAVAIVNEELARHLWSERNPIGERLRLGAAGEAAPIVTVVGVVRSVRRSPMHDAPMARVYLPFAQHPNPGVELTVRARHDVARVARALEGAVARADPLLVADHVRPVESEMAQFVAPLRLMTWLLTGFGAAGALLAALGVFGTMSYLVSLRRHELAIRAALGAHRASLLGLVLGSALRIGVLGLFAGVALAFAAARALNSYLFGVTARDPVTYTLAAVLLMAVCLAACYWPARTAAAADPAALLRP